MALNKLSLAPAGEVLTGTIGALNAVLGGAVDALNYQSVSIQITGTWSGTLTFQVSNDNVNWITKTMYSPSLNASATTTANNIFSADIGSRYFRAQMTSYASGTASVTIAFSGAGYETLRDTQPISGSVTANPNLVEQVETSTNLGASATYTGAARDMGTTVATRRTLLRPVILHTAGNTPGSLVLQESTDGTTWRETRRAPIPSDASYRSFEWPLHLRYYRLLFINGATAQTAFFLQTVATQGEGGTMDMKNNLSFLLSTTALTASQTFTGPVLDLGDNHTWDKIIARVNLATASTTCSVRIESSHDGTTWAYNSASQVTTTTADVLYVTRTVVERYHRVVVVNGSTAQASNQITAALVSL